MESARKNPKNPQGDYLRRPTYLAVRLHVVGGHVVHFVHKMAAHPQAEQVLERNGIGGVGFALSDFGHRYVVGVDGDEEKVADNV